MTATTATTATTAKEFFKKHGWTLAYLAGCGLLMANVVFNKPSLEVDSTRPVSDVVLTFNCKDLSLRSASVAVPPETTAPPHTVTYGKVDNFCTKNFRFLPAVSSVAFYYSCPDDKIKEVAVDYRDINGKLLPALNGTTNMSDEDQRCIIAQ